MDKFVELIRDHPQQVSALVALCAVLLSFLSIILTATALWLQRRHYFKSITPIANIYFCDAEDQIQLTLKNAGVGPLIIESFTVSSAEKTTGNIWDFVPKDLNYSDLTTHLDGVCVSPEEEITLVEFKGDAKDPEFVSSRNKLRDALSSLQLMVNYQDIYHRRMKHKPSDLGRWFGRPEPGEAVRTPDGVAPASAVVTKRQ